MKITLTFLIALLSCVTVFPHTLHVGTGYPFASLTDAAQAVNPGDTIMVHEGTYPGGLYIENLQGTAQAWIVIMAAPGETVIYEGGSNAWQLTDAAYLHIQDFIFQHQTGNGINFDDGGSYATPAHHLIFENCIFRDMAASSNNDLLKLSGVDDFEVRQSTFLNGAAGGSGIDMVGCHRGVISLCYFENLGSNSVQAKGGTSEIRIERNFFKNGGQRTLNLGGSTGLQFFRPIDAPYEAADLYVYSNVFIGSLAPVAFVGSIDCEVINNTIYLPERWVLRILQETVDTTRFPPCGHNTFRNNILYIDDQTVTACNIGPNTAPETFTFSNNLWFHATNPGWTGPTLPVQDMDQVIGEDPLFTNSNLEDFSIQMESPAIGAGFELTIPELDFMGIPFNSPRSIGAFEGDPIISISRHAQPEDDLLLFPNPASGSIFISWKSSIPDIYDLAIYTLSGYKVMSMVYGDQNSSNTIELALEKLPSGFYFIHVNTESGVYSKKLIIK